MQQTYNHKLVIRSDKDLDRLKKWLKSRPYDTVASIDSGYILTHGGERTGVIIIEDPALLHNNALRLIGVEVMGGKE